MANSMTKDNEIKEDVITEGTHSYSAEKFYIEPMSPIKEKLENFKDMKLGFMIHWGLYSQLGLMASWGLVDAEAEWSRKNDEYDYRPTWLDDGNKIRDEYFDLIHSFNPVRFNPDEWAELAVESGFKYLIFTTKHHDGFCLWDTKQTDFKVTAENCPFSKHEKADVVKCVFEAFRKRNLAIGAYFSKPDWHCEDYWESDVWRTTPTTRMPTYDVKEKPEKWQAFTEYTHKQFEELVCNYGKVDILWLDGGQVCTREGLDIKLGDAVEKLRKINPELIVVDRTAGGEYENYITPEQTIPEKVISVPWESCLTIGRDFNYIYDDDYKSPEELIELLLEIVCKGGNLALNVSPQPDGRMPRNAIKSLKGLGNWLKKYGEAIYKTRPCAPYKENDIFFTQTTDCVYAISRKVNPDFIPCEQKICKVEYLNYSCNVDFEQTDKGIMICVEGQAAEFNVFKLYKK